MDVRADRYYTKDHEWALEESGVVKVGISSYAQEELGDVVFADMPAVGTKVQQGKSLGTVESVKAVSDIYAPVTGEVVEVNEQLKSSPQLINEDPFGAGWMVVIKPDANLAEAKLLSSKDYEAHLQSL